MNTKQLAGTVLGTIVKLAVAAAVIFYIYKAAGMAYDYGYRIFAEEPVAEAPGFDVAVTITADKSVKDIGELLESRGLIRDSKLFVIQELLSENHGEIKEGVYTLNTSMTTDEMLSIMTASEEETEKETEGSEEMPATESETPQETSEAETESGETP